jgi:DNA helicase HerA-like ATPase
MLYHLVGRETTNPDYPRKREFSLQFARLSPYTVAEILDLTEAQVQRFLIAYDAATLKQQIAQLKLDSPVSWRALLGKPVRLYRLKVFDVDNERVTPLRYKPLLRPGAVSVIDLSDSGMSELSNLVIADLLRGVQDEQDEAYKLYDGAKGGERDVPPPSRVLIIVEEAHEFLSAERIEKMPVLFQQVARIAKRGRKRWLGLVFVTQLLQNLPPQLFGLVNSYILHKITDPRVVSALERTVSGIDEGLWNRPPASRRARRSSRSRT